MPTWNGSDALVQEPLESPGPRRRWQADAGGRPALALEARMGSPREAETVGERLRRLHARPDPHLRQLLGWAVEGSTAWALTPAAEGRRLAALLRSGPLSPAEGAAVAWSVLTGLEAMHQAGLAHGSVSAENVLVEESGQARLDGGWFRPAVRSGADELEADVEAAGALGLAVLGIPAAGGGPATRAELEAPALARTMRAIASGASGSNVAGARMALGATAGPLVDAGGLARARELLARRAGGGEGVSAPRAAAPAPLPAPPAPVPAPTPPPAPRAIEPEPGQAVEPAPAVPARHYVATAADFEAGGPGFDWGRLVLPLGAAAAVLIVAALAWMGISALAHSGGSAPAADRAPAPATTPSPARTSSAGPTASARPSPAPSFGPPAAGAVTAVSIQLSGCAPGGACGSEIIVQTAKAAATNDIAWTVRAYDPCTGATSDVGSGHFTEQAGWTSIDVNQALTLPAGRGQLLVAAVVTAPAGAASPPVTVGQGSC